jgi:hypothetical protein
MSDTAFSEPDLTLLLGPNDSAIRVGNCPPRRAGGRDLDDSLHVVVHRSHGDWTHVYRVQQGEPSDRLQVHLLKVYEGERVPEARDWTLSKFAAAPGA